MEKECDFVKKFITILSMLFVLLSFNTVFATNSAWKDPAYDFSKINTVYVEPEIIYAPSCSIGELELYKNLVALDEEKDKLDDFEIVDDKSLADAVITMNVTSWNIKETYVPTKEYTDTANIEYVDTDGSKTYEPVTFDLYTEEHYVYEQYFTAEFTVTDKEGKVIYKKVENRQADKDTFAMFGRAIKDFYDDFNEIKEEYVKALKKKNK